jgi:16S rRNA U516 pseudouridylate synthase RsuA-like enzyme
MTSGVIDTLKLARALRDKAHFSAEDAEGAAAAIADAIQSDVATKSDLRLAVSEIRTEISEAKYETVKRVAGMIGFQTIAMIGAVIALLHLSR